MFRFFKSARGGRPVRRQTLALLQQAIEPLERRQMFSTVPSGFSETQVAAGLNNPTTMAFAPDGRIFVAEQAGTLKVIKNGQVLATPFTKIGVNPFGERGLLGVAIDPNFATNKYLYVYYTITDGSVIRNRITRFTANGDVADPASKTIIYNCDPLNPDVQIHNSGGMAFGPDGKLYVGVGENFNGPKAQDLTTNLGKILRINSDGTIPTDNPFYNTATTASGKAVWAYGFRNPFSMDIQPGTGRIFYNDVGYNTWEEIDEIKKGKNYGWPNTEGPTTDSKYETPIYTYKHGDGIYVGDCIAGGAFYNPDTANFPSAYNGMYFFADFTKGWIDYIDPTKPASSSTSDANHSSNVHNFATGLTSPVNLKVGPDGALYYLQRGVVTSTTSTNGAIYKISYSSVGVKPGIVTQPAAQTESQGQTATFTVSASGTAPLTYQWKKNGTNISGATSKDYTTPTLATSNNGDLYSVVITNAYGTITSSSAKLTVLANQAPTATITAPTSSYFYKGGDTLNFAATATDDEDGTLPASAYTWQIVFHHDQHEHPFYPATTGIKSGSVTIPQDGETATDVYYHIILTVKDSSGATFTTTHDVEPIVVNLNYATAVVGGGTISGLQATVDGVPFTDLRNDTGVVGIHRELDVVSPQTINGVSYVFDHWSDNGTQQHVITTPATNNTTYTAFFKPGSTAVQNGLTAVYYNNKDFTGSTVSRIDQTLDFYWTGAPVTGISAQTFSVRWTGQVQAAKSETYNLIFRADDGVRVTFGGNVIIDQLHDTSGIVEYTKAVALTAGTKYDLKVDYYNNKGAGGARLFWSSPSTPRAIIPNAALFTAGSTTPNPATYTSADIGNPALAGSTLVVTAGSAYNVSAAGSDIYGSSDQFRFVYQSVTGDFTIKTQISSLANTNDNAKAGLMARESLAADSRNVFAFVTPYAYKLSVRSTTGGATTPSGSGSTAYPKVWLQLKRVGNVFTASRSTDGVTWTTISSTTQVFPSTLLLGMAVTSHNTAQSTTAAFGNLG